MWQIDKSLWKVFVITNSTTSNLELILKHMNHKQKLYIENFSKILICYLFWYSISTGKINKICRSLQISLEKKNWDWIP